MWVIFFFLFFLKEEETWAMQEYTEYEHQRTRKKRESINREQSERGMDNEISPGSRLNLVNALGKAGENHNFCKPTQCNSGREQRT